MIVLPLTQILSLLRAAFLEMPILFTCIVTQCPFMTFTHMVLATTLTSWYGVVVVVVHSWLNSSII